MTPDLHLVAAGFNLMNEQCISLVGAIVSGCLLTQNGYQVFFFTSMKARKKNFKLRFLSHHMSSGAGDLGMSL